MKNKIYTISLLAFLTAANAFGQKPVFELTFTASNGGQSVILDSINIENLTQGGDTTLYAPNNVLTLDFATGIGGNNENGTNQFSVSQNYPNPFDGQTTIHLNVPEKDLITISILICWDMRWPIFPIRLMQVTIPSPSMPGKKNTICLLQQAAAEPNP